MSDRKQKIKEIIAPSPKLSRQELRERGQSVHKRSHHGDTGKLLLAAILVVGGVIGFTLLSKHPLYIRGLVLLGAILLSVAIVFLWSEAGLKLIRYVKDSVVEIKKVVWPARNEAWRNTFFVLGFTAVMTLFLWLVDTFLAWLFMLNA